VATAEPELQRLKPRRFDGVYVVAKATTSKSCVVGTQTLKPVLLLEGAVVKACLAVFPGTPLIHITLANALQ